MHHKKNYQRDQLIYEQRVLDKRTLKGIGEEHGIHKERVRQIVYKQEYFLQRPFSKRALTELWPLRHVLMELSEGVDTL